jgi:hypothetical protein
VRSADGGAAEVVLAEQLTAMLLTLVQQQQQPIDSTSTSVSNSGNGSMQQWNTALTAQHPRLLQLCTQQQWSVSPALLSIRLELLLALLHLQQQQQASADVDVQHEACTTQQQLLPKLMAVAVSYCDALSAVAAVRLSGLLACELLLQQCNTITNNSSNSSSGSSSAGRRNRLKPLSDSPEPLAQGVHAAAALAFAALSRRLADADAGVSTRTADVMAALLPFVRRDMHSTTSSSSGDSQPLPQAKLTSGDSSSSDNSTAVVASDALIPQWQFSYEGLLGVCLAHLAVAASESKFADQLDAVLRVAAVLDTAVFAAAVSAKRTELGSAAAAEVQQALSDLDEHAELLLSFQSRG